MMASAILEGRKVIVVAHSQGNYFANEAYGRLSSSEKSTSISVSAADRRQLEALIRDRNAAQKHVWRAEIVLLTSEGVGTNEIIRRTGKSQDLRLALAGTLHGWRVRGPAS